MRRFCGPTLPDVIQAVSGMATSDQETRATVVDLINRGTVRWCGEFAGVAIDRRAKEDAA